MPAKFKSVGLLLLDILHYMTHKILLFEKKALKFRAGIFKLHMKLKL